MWSKRAAIVASLSSLAIVCYAGRPISAKAAPLYRAEAIVPNASASGQARAINARGDIAGQIDGSAFVWRSGHFTIYSPGNSNSMDLYATGIATAINRDGLAVGHLGSYALCSMSGLEMVTAVFYRNAKIVFLNKALQTPGFNGKDCGFEIDGINDRGTTVGIAAYRGFVRSAGGHTIKVDPLSTRPEDNGTRASAIDNEGTVVGGTTIDVPRTNRISMGVQRDTSGTERVLDGPDPNDYVIHAFLARFDSSGQHMRDLGSLPNFPNSYATALNEDHAVVGYTGTKSGPKWTRVTGESHAWVWQNGRMTDLGNGSKESSFAYAVNDANVIVGCAGPNAVRWVNKNMQDLNRLIDRRSGLHLTCAHGINRSGVIVGAGEQNGRLVPFRLVPLAR